MVLTSGTSRHSLLTLERPTGLVEPIQEMICLYLKNYNGYYAETS